MKNLPNVSSASARFSDDMKHRFSLIKTFPGSGRRILWIMANPSVASATEDDPTVRKCQQFSLRWDYSIVTIVNLYSFIATDPGKLKAQLVQPTPSFLMLQSQNLLEIDSQIRMHANDARIVCAWGSLLGQYKDEPVDSVIKFAAFYEAILMALKVNTGNIPGHPLYIGYKEKPFVWRGYGS